MGPDVAADTALAREVLQIVGSKELSQDEAKRRGFAPQTLSRWDKQIRDNEPVKMSRANRISARKLIEEHEMTQSIESTPNAEGWLVREMERIRHELPTERERALAIDVRASALRAAAMIEAERRGRDTEQARIEAERARAEAERAARQRAEAATLAEQRALLTCRGPDGDGDSAPAKTRRRKPAAGSEET